MLAAGFLSLGVLVFASNMTADGREEAKGKTIPYTLEIVLPGNASEGSTICFRQAAQENSGETASKPDSISGVQESRESKYRAEKAHENAAGNLVIGYNKDTGRPSVFFTGQEEIILNEKNELIWKDCRQPVMLTDKIQVVSTPDYDYRFLMKDAEGREQILSFSYAKMQQMPDQAVTVSEEGVPIVNAAYVARMKGTALLQGEIRNLNENGYEEMAGFLQKLADEKIAVSADGSIVPKGESLPPGMVLLSAASPVSRVNVSDETLYSWSAFFDQVEEIRKEEEWKAYLESLRSQEKKGEAAATAPAPSAPAPSALAPAETAQPTATPDDAPPPEPTEVPTTSTP